MPAGRRGLEACARAPGDQLALGDGAQDLQGEDALRVDVSIGSPNDRNNAAAGDNPDRPSGPNNESIAMTE